MPADERTRDRASAKASIALADSTQTLLHAQRAPSRETQAHIKKAVNKNGDATAALGHASHDLSLRRRQAIRPLLQRSWSALGTIHSR